ncbi:flagellar biosynthesis anti-sigma factor FlgM [Sporosarcina siberiensis]|uniref:Negative regulator of flagellin synthesis n=1 Tax=Sporosarcina siberiensis TaxID=1365606 RepID=A0ABW4SBK8_9BACL
MKINNFNMPPVNPYKANQQKVEKTETKVQKQTDKLEISNEAKQLSGIPSFSVERNERVQEIKAQVDAGTYKVDPETIAKNLMNYYKN